MTVEGLWSDCRVTMERQWSNNGATMERRRSNISGRDWMMSEVDWLGQQSVDILCFQVDNRENGLSLS